LSFFNAKPNPSGNSDRFFSITGYFAETSEIPVITLVVRGYFTGWLDPAKLELFDHAVLADVLIACIDDAHAAGDTSALKILDRREKAD
jgi:hypothetical protein